MPSEHTRLVHRSIILMFLLFCGSTLADPTTGPVMTELADKLPESGEYHLLLFNEDKPDGYMRLGWYQDGDELVVYDRSSLPSMEVFETMQLTMASTDLQPINAAVRFHQGNAIMYVDVQMEENRMEGERRLERPGLTANTKSVELDLPPGTVFRAVSFIVPLVLDATPGQQLSYDWYSSISNEIQAVSLQSEDGGALETPAGTFDTVKWQLRGGTPENDIYVTREPHPRIVRIDVLGQNMYFLATSPPTP